MAVAGVLATQLNPTTTHNRGLFVHGQDVIDEPTTNTMGYGVPIDSISVDEEGPGGVSSMTFTIDDPNIVITVTDGDDVRFWDFTNNVPIFTGWVQSWTYVNAFGTTGRQIVVVAQGPESILDWAAIPSLSLASGLDFVAAVQAAVSASVSPGPLRAFSIGGASTQAAGIDDLSGKFGGPGVINSAMTFTGTTLRETIRQILVNTTASPSVLFSGFKADCYVTVDMYYGLRIYSKTDKPNDWVQLNVLDTPGSPLFSSDFAHISDTGEIVRSVVVVGGNAAGTGVVSDGTGKMGQTAVITDATILTDVAMRQAAAAYFADFQVVFRGTLTLEDWTPQVTSHAGSTILFTDARIGLNNATYHIFAIVKTFHAVREDWTIQYGGMAPSAMRAIRRLTRNVLS